MEYLYYSSEYSDQVKDFKNCELISTPVLVTILGTALQKGSPLLVRVNEIIADLEKVA
jgi:hypothetical protein